RSWRPGRGRYYLNAEPTGSTFSSRPSDQELSGSPAVTRRAARAPSNRPRTCTCPIASTVNRHGSVTSNLGRLGQAWLPQLTIRLAAGSEPILLQIRRWATVLTEQVLEKTDALPGTIACTLINRDEN